MSAEHSPEDEEGCMSGDLSSKELVETLRARVAAGRCSFSIPFVYSIIEALEQSSANPEPEPALDDHSELMKKLPNARPELLAEIRKQSRWALERRVLIQADWLGSYSKCLDGFGLRYGVDGCWNPRDIREAVEKLRAAQPPTEHPDKARLDWLNEQPVHFIELDDFSIIDVKGLDVRAAIDARRASVTKSCRCPAGPGNVCTLTEEQCRARTSGETSGARDE